MTIKKNTNKLHSISHWLKMTLLILKMFASIKLSLEFPSQHKFNEEAHNKHFQRISFYTNVYVCQPIKLITVNRLNESLLH